MIRHKQIKKLKAVFVAKKLQEFFNEDNILNDITTKATQKKNHNVEAFFIAKENLVFVGKEIIKQGFKECVINNIQKEGANVKAGDIIATMRGPIDAILQKERVVLNLLQRLSGIATTTNCLVKKLKNKNIQLLDTRKTTPGLREFEKFAVYINKKINKNKKYKLMIAHANAKIKGDKLSKLIIASNPNIINNFVLELGGALGAHAGPGALVVGIQEID